MKRFDVVVIGAGAAGVGSAIAARRTAGRVLLIDEGPTVGGRLRWRRGPFEFPELGSGTFAGPDLVERLAQMLSDAGITVWNGTAVWGLFPGVVAAMSGGGPVYVEAKAVVVASGSVDLAWPVPGWTLPGVITGSGLLRLVNESHFLPGQRYALVGESGLATECGQAIEAVGGEVVWRGPVETLNAIEGNGQVERIVTSDGVIEVDSVVIALGLRPDPALVIEAQAAVEWDEATASPRPLLSPTGESSIPGLFVAGDAAGLCRTPADAFANGLRVGATASGGQITPSQTFERVIDRLPINPSLSNDLIIDRSEEISIGDIRQAIDASHGFDLDDVLRMTRLGMGECQGDYALPGAARIVAELTGRPPTMGRQRAPARLLPVGAMVERWVETSRGVVE